MQFIPTILPEVLMSTPRLFTYSRSLFGESYQGERFAEHDSTVSIGLTIPGISLIWSTSDQSAKILVEAEVIQ